MQPTVHGPPVQARVVAAYRAVLATFRDDPGAHGDEPGGRGNAEQNGAK